MPRVKKLDATDLPIGQDGVVTMSSVGAAVLEQPEIQVVDGPKALELASELAFMEEPVAVTVHQHNGQNPEPVVPIWVNGRCQVFPRGQSITVKRKFVEGLARAKPTTYRNEEYVNQEGDKAFRYPTATGLRYPFQIDRDDNPRGADWIRKILAEA
jgi:hypothetical protein